MAKGQAQEQSPELLLDRDIANIMSHSNRQNLEIKYNIMFHTKEHDIGAILLMAIESVRNYNTNVADYILVTAKVSAGDFITKILPNRNDLEISIMLVHTTNKNLKDITTRYKFNLTNKYTNLDNSRYARMTEEQLNKSEVIEVEGQAILREMLGLRTIFTQGIYRNCTLKDVLHCEMIEAAKNVKVESKEVELLMDIAEPANKNEYSSIIIPTGVPLLSLPSYLQHNEYGLYNGHIGTYIQYCMLKGKEKAEPVMFIYPLYDSERYDKAKQKLQIFLSNTSKYDYVYNTYCVEDDVVKIIANTNSKILDTGDTSKTDKGDSYVTFNPDLIMYRPYMVTNDDVTINKDDLLTGAYGEEKEDNVHKVRYIPPDSNIYKYRSDILKKSFVTMQIKWLNANVEWLYPGMPVCFVYETVRDGIRKAYGTLQAVYWNYSTQAQSSTALLTIAVARKKEDKKK